MTVAIDDEIAAHDRPGARRRRLDPAQRHADTGQQFLGAEWLRDVVVGARVQRANLVGLRATRGQHENRRRASVSQQPAHLDAVHVGQSQVQNDEVGVNPFNALQAGFPGHGGGDLVAARAEQRRHRGENGRFIVHDQHA